MKPKLDNDFEIKVALDTIARELQGWIDWEYEKCIKSGLEPTDDMAIMCPPVWPSVRVIRNWILVLRKCESIVNIPDYMIDPNDWQIVTGSSVESKVCAHCQYFRAPDVMPTFDETWCSNSKSKSSLAHVTKSDTCDQFYKRGKKAPLWMRIAKKVLK